MALIRSPRAWTAAFGLGFLLLLIYVTWTSAPAPAPRAADLVCQRAVREQVANARFPFAARASDVGEGQIVLSGIVDAARAGETIRRNYTCWVRRVSPGDLLVDSLHVWQSH